MAPVRKDGSLPYLLLPTAPTPPSQPQAHAGGACNPGLRRACDGPATGLRFRNVRCVSAQPDLGEATRCRTMSYANRSVGWSVSVLSGVNRVEGRAARIVPAGSRFIHSACTPGSCRRSTRSCRLPTDSCRLMPRSRQLHDRKRPALGRLLQAHDSFLQAHGRLLRHCWPIPAGI